MKVQDQEIKIGITQMTPDEIGGEDRNCKVAAVLKNDLFGVVRAYYKDYTSGSALVKRYGITLQELLDYLDEHQDDADLFNKELEDLASRRIERCVAVGMSHLVDELSGASSPEGLKALQNAIATLLSVRKSFKMEGVHGRDKVEELEQTLRNLGL